MSALIVVLLILRLVLAPLLGDGQRAAPASNGQSLGSLCWSNSDRATSLQPDSASGKPIQQWTRPPLLVIDPTDRYEATFTTSQGTFVVELDAVAAPVAVNNFICLALAGYYDHTTFDRIVANFVIQGVDPTGTGRSGPGYTFKDEPVTRPYTKGTLAMANAGPNTNGSQFFICLSDVDLPPNSTIFGQVATGMKVVEAIGRTPTEVGPTNEKSTPIEPVVIESIAISTVDATASASPTSSPAPCANDASDWGFCALPGYQTRAANVFRTQAGVSPAGYLVIGVARFDSPGLADLNEHSGLAEMLLVTVFTPSRSVHQISLPPIAEDDLVYAGPSDTVNSRGTPVADSTWSGALMLIAARQGPLIWYGFLLSDTMEGAAQLADVMRTAVARHPDTSGALADKLPTLADLPGGWMLVSAGGHGEYS